MLALFMKLFAVFIFFSISLNLNAESPSSNFYEMNIPPEALAKSAEAGDPNAMFDYGNCLYGGICKGIGIKNRDQLISRNAYVFGVSDYGNKSLNLPWPVNDAKDIMKLLSQNKYNVKLFENPTLSDFKSVFDKKVLKESLEISSKRNDVLFYFSGHGVSFGGKNYLIPKGFEAKENGSSLDITSLISVNQIVKFLDSNFNGIKIFILDACRNSGSSGDKNTKASSLPFVSKDGSLYINNSDAGLSPVEAGSNTYIMYSSAPGKESIGFMSERNSLFTDKFLKNFNNDKEQDIDDLMMSTRSKVMESSDSFQIPWNESSLNNPYFLGSREVDKNEKDLGIYWISRSAATGEVEAATIMMATFYCTGSEARIKRNISKGKSILEKIIDQSGDPISVMTAKMALGSCIDNPPLTYTIEEQLNILGNMVCAEKNCLEIIEKNLISTKLSEELRSSILILLAYSNEEYKTKYIFSTYSALLESPEIFNMINNMIVSGFYDEMITEKEKLNPLNLAWFIIRNINELFEQGYKESVLADQ